MSADLVDGARPVAIGMRQNPAAAVPEAEVQSLLRRDTARRVRALIDRLAQAG